MTVARENGRGPARRRVPQQVRSRDRVQRILEVAAEIVVDQGVEAVTTRAIAAGADLPVASLYQYFADKESVLLALVERDIAEMDAQVEEDLGALTVLSVRAMVETTMRAFVKVYHRRPSFVTIWFRGRTNVAVQEYIRAHNRRMAQELFHVARSSRRILATARWRRRRRRRRLQHELSCSGRRWWNGWRWATASCGCAAPTIASCSPASRRARWPGR